MNATAIHAPARGATRARIALGLAAVALLANLAVQPVRAQPGDTDALARYQARQAHALAIEQELRHRVAALEQQDAALGARSGQLQRQLGELLQARQANDAEILRLQAEAEGKEKLLAEAHARVGHLEQQLREVQRKIDEYERNKWTCYVPFAQIYCLVVELMGQRNGLEQQRRAFIIHLQAVQRDRDAAQARLEQVRRARGAFDAQQARLKGEADAVVQQLQALHAELARSREAHQRQRVSLDSFSAELKQVEALPPSDRPGVIERRLNRLDAQLAGEMGQACQLFGGEGPPLPEPVRRACALA